MSKRGIVGRVMQLARADVGAMIDSAGNPEEMLDRLLSEYTATIAAAEQAIAQLIGNLRIAEDDQAQDARVIARWHEKAAAASQSADELRAGGAAAEADRFDTLARIALARQLTAESDVQSVQHTMDAQQESADRLRNGLGQMRVKLSELRDKRDDLVARSRSGRAGPGLPQASASTDILDPASDLARFDECVRREQAREELAAPAADAQFAPRHDRGRQTEISERLRELKAARAMASATARAHDQSAG